MAAVALKAAILVHGPATAAFSVFLAADGLHGVTDTFGGGLELKPLVYPTVPIPSTTVRAGDDG